MHSDRPRSGRRGDENVMFKGIIFMEFNIVTIISIIINIILASFLFFKSALNDILKDWWANRTSHRKTIKQKLSELRLGLLKIKDVTPLLLIQIATFKFNSQAAVEIGESNQYKKSVEEYGIANNKIREGEIYCNKNVRDLIDIYYNKTSKATEDAISSNLDKEKMKTIIKDLTNTINTIVKEVEIQISKT